jgi:hypothetical protein
MYVATVSEPSRAPREAPINSTAKVCPVTGTGLKGSGISTRAARVQRCSQRNDSHTPERALRYERKDDRTSRRDPHPVGRSASGVFMVGDSLASRWAVTA